MFRNIPDWHFKAPRPGFSSILQVFWALRKRGGRQLSLAIRGLHLCRKISSYGPPNVVLATLIPPNITGTGDIRKVGKYLDWRQADPTKVLKMQLMCDVFIIVFLLYSGGREHHCQWWMSVVSVVPATLALGSAGILWYDISCPGLALVSWLLV